MQEKKGIICDEICVKNCYGIAPVDAVQLCFNVNNIFDAFRLYDFGKS